MSNPFSSPNASAAPKRHFPLAVVAGLWIGGILLLAMAISIPSLIYIYSQYPLLADSSHPVKDWPMTVVFIATMVAGLGAVVGIPVFWVSFKLFQQFKQRSDQ